MPQSSRTMVTFSTCRCQRAASGAWALAAPAMTHTAAMAKASCLMSPFSCKRGKTRAHLVGLSAQRRLGLFAQLQVMSIRFDGRGSVAYPLGKTPLLAEHRRKVELAAKRDRKALVRAECR